MILKFGFIGILNISAFNIYVADSTSAPRAAQLPGCGSQLTSGVGHETFSLGCKILKNMLIQDDHHRDCETKGWVLKLGVFFEDFP